MKKKDFLKLISYHDYNARKKGGFRAIFFDWKDGDNFRGFKYCVWARGEMATKIILIDILYNYITGKDAELKSLPYFVQFIEAQTDEQRFKVPFMSNGLTGLIKYPKNHPKV